MGVGAEIGNREHLNNMYLSTNISRMLAIFWGIQHGE